MQCPEMTTYGRWTMYDGAMHGVQVRFNCFIVKEITYRLEKRLKIPIFFFHSKIECEAYNNMLRL